MNKTKAILHSTRIVYIELFSFDLKKITCECKVHVAILFDFLMSLTFQHSDRSIKQASFHIRDIFSGIFLVSTSGK